MSSGWSDDASRALWTLERAQGVLLHDVDGLRLLSRHALPDDDPTSLAAILLAPELPPARALADALHARELNHLDEGRLGRWARRVRELSARPPGAAPPAGRWRGEDVPALARRGEARVADLALALGHARALERASDPHARSLAALALRQRALIGGRVSLDPISALTRPGAPLDLLAAHAADPSDPLAARAAAACLGRRGAIGRAGDLTALAARAHRAHHLAAVDALTLSERLFAIVDPLAAPVAERIVRAARRAILAWGEDAGVELARHAAARHTADAALLDAVDSARALFVSAVTDRVRRGDIHAGAAWLDDAFASSGHRRPFTLTRALRGLLASLDLRLDLPVAALESAARESFEGDPSLEAAARAVSDALWAHARGAYQGADASVRAWHVAPSLLSPGARLEPFLGEQKASDFLMRSVSPLPRPLFLEHWPLLVRHAASRTYGALHGLGPMLEANVPPELLEQLLEHGNLDPAYTLAPRWDLIRRCDELDALVGTLSVPLRPYHVWDFALGGADRFALVGAASLAATLLDADFASADHDLEDIADLFEALGLEPPDYDVDAITRAARALATTTITSLLGRATGDPAADLALCAFIRQDAEDLDAILDLTRALLEGGDLTPDLAALEGALGADDGVDLARWLEGPDAVAHWDDRGVHVTSSRRLHDALSSSPQGWDAEPILALRAALDPLALIVTARDAASGDLLVAARVGVSAGGRVVRAPWSGPLAHDVGARALSDDAVLAHAAACGLTPSDTASPRAALGPIWTHSAPWRRQVAHAAPLPSSWPRDLASSITWELRQAVLFEDDEAILQLVNAPDPAVRGAALSWRWRRDLAGAPWSPREGRVRARAEAAIPTDLQRPIPWLRDLVGDPTEAGVLALRGGAHPSRSLLRGDVIDAACEHHDLPLFDLTSLHVDDALSLLSRFGSAFIRGRHCRDPFGCASCKGAFFARADAISALVVRDDGVSSLARALESSIDLFHIASLSRAAARFPCDAIARVARVALERSPDGHHVSHSLARVLDRCARPEDADAILAALTRDPSSSALALAGAACGARARVLEVFSLPDAPDALARVGTLDPDRALKRLRRATLRAAADGSFDDLEKVLDVFASFAARLRDPAPLEDLIGDLARRLEDVPADILRGRARARYDEAAAPAPPSTRQRLEELHRGGEGAAQAARALAFSGDERAPVSTSWSQILRGCWPSSPELFTPEERGAIARATLGWRFPIYASSHVKRALDWASFGAPPPTQDDLYYHCFLGDDLDFVYAAGAFALVYALAYHPASEYARALLIGLASQNAPSVGARAADLVLLESGLEDDERLAAAVVSAIPWEPTTLAEISFLIVDPGAVSPPVARMLVSHGARHVDAAGAAHLAQAWRLRGPRGRWAAALLTSSASARGPS